MYKILEHARGLRLIEFYNNNNFHVILSNYGASIFEIDTVDKNGELEIITMTPKSSCYFENNKSCGLTIGRVIGRIKDAKFTINDIEYKIKPNEYGNLLHSGKESFSRKFFDFYVDDDNEKTIVTFVKNVNDMEDGFPGDLEVKVVYTLFKTIDKMRVEYKAYSNKDTLLNITNHAYFNLSGNLKRNILDEYLSINKSKIFEMDDELIFTKLVDVKKEYDFRVSKKIGEDINHDSIKFSTRGYDNCYTDDNPVHVTMWDKESGRYMEINSNYKDVVIYSNNNQSIDSYIPDKDDQVYLGLAIEPSRLSKTFNTYPIQKAHTLYNYYIEYNFGIKEE